MFIVVVWIPDHGVPRLLHEGGELEEPQLVVPDAPALPGGAGGLGRARQTSHPHPEAGRSLLRVEERILSEGLHVVRRGLAQAGVLPEASVRDGGSHPGLHVSRGRHDLGAGHLLHLLESFLPLGGIKVGGGTLAGHLQHTPSLPACLLLELQQL